MVYAHKPWKEIIPEKLNLACLIEFQKENVPANIIQNRVIEYNKLIIMRAPLPLKQTYITFPFNLVHYSALRFERIHVLMQKYLILSTIKVV